MVARSAKNGMAGADIDQPISAAHAAELAAAGISFIVRYIPRTAALTGGNVTNAEINAILSAGLAMSFVQHVAESNWVPSAALGTQYGGYAASYAKQAGIPVGVNIWVDLEEVGIGDVEGYLHAWFAAVQAAGYVAGVYVGWQTQLSDEQLYDLPFAHYWRAYNCDQSIPKRGYQIIQHTQKAIAGIECDPNTVQTDQLGGLPIFLFAA